MNIPVIICGDFNLNLLNPLKLGYITEFINNMLEIGMYPLIGIPTKYNPDNIITKYSILDHIWTNVPSLIPSSYVIPLEITDHFPVAISVDLDDRVREVTLIKRKLIMKIICCSGLCWRVYIL